MAKEKTIQETLSLYDEHFWQNLYKNLRKPVTSFVHRSHLPSWVGQEEDIVTDIIQETIMRVYKKILAAPDDVFSIQSLEAFAYTIAYRYFLDLLRKEKRLLPLPRDQYELEIATTAVSENEELDMMLEAITALSVLNDAAHIIATLPNKQRRALLVDLARYNDFTEEPTLMEQAFAQVGIQLRDYCQLFPLDSGERMRHNSLLSMAYRRLRLDFQAASDEQQVAKSASSLYPQKIACNVLESSYRRLGMRMSPERASKTTDVFYATEEQTSKGLVPDRDSSVIDENDCVSSPMVTLINELREPYRNAVRLHYQEGYTYPKIAEQLHLPVGTVKSHVSRGRKMLDILAMQKEHEALQTDEESHGETQQITKSEIVAYASELREPYRSAIHLHCLEEHSYPKTAEHLQLPVGTVKSLVSRGKKMLLEMHRKCAI